MTGYGQIREWKKNCREVEPLAAVTRGISLYRAFRRRACCFDRSTPMMDMNDSAVGLSTAGPHLAEGIDMGARLIYSKRHSGPTSLWKEMVTFNNRCRGLAIRDTGTAIAIRQHKMFSAMFSLRSYL